jgi:hypothetical protein
MRDLIPVLAAVMTPILVLVLIVGGVAFHVVEWRPPVAWSTQFGTSNAENYVTTLSVDPTALYAGGFVGYSRESYLTPSPSYVFLSKYDLNGHQVWTQQVGDPKLGTIVGIVPASDGVYTLGTQSANSSLVVAKYGQDGSEAWINEWGSPIGITWRGTTTTAISLGTTGLYVGSLGTDNPNGTMDILVRHYDFQGNIVWTKALGNEGNESTGGPVIIYASSSGLYVSGSDDINFPDTHAFLSKYDLNGTLEWTRLFDQPPGFICQCMPVGIQADTSGLYLLGNSVNGFPGQSSLGGLFIRKYDWNGNTLWTTLFGALDGSSVSYYQMSVGTTGVYVIEATGRANDFMLKYDLNGNSLWSFPIPQVPAALSANDGGIYVGGAEKAGYSLAFTEELTEPSSLIFFGINPPYSFLVVGGLVAATTASILFYRRKLKRRPVSKAPVPPKTSGRSDDNPLPGWKPA